MKKRLLVLLAVLLVLAACTPGVLAYDVAAEQAEDFGTASLESALPEQATMPLARCPLRMPRSHSPC